MSASSKPPLKTAIIGLGTVGSGVARILLNHGDRIAQRAGRPVLLQRAVVRDLSKSRDVVLPADTVTNDVQTVIDDPDIELAIQLIGGIEPARTIMLALLAAGKDIVTANKALLCEHGDELFRQARELGRTISFEAAVAGGIPIIATVGQCLAANQITSIAAILNGTSNFILSQMRSSGRSYDDVLGEAQRLGYAEADPTMDVDGTDAAQKLVLLAQLAYGTRVPLDAFPRQGIDTLDLADVQYAAELGYTIKLLAVARLVNRQLEMHVQPTLIRSDRPLAKTDGPFNIIAVDGDAVGPVWLSGAGAGQMPTASAVVADVIDVATGRASRTFERLDLWQESPQLPLQPAENVARRYYLRFNVEDRPHVLADITDALGRKEISIASVIQHEAPEQDDTDTMNQTGPALVPLVIMTHRTTEGRIRAADALLADIPSLRDPRVRMPVAD